MRRIVKVLAVVVLMAAVLVAASIPAFARPLRGGVELQKARVVCAMLAESHPRFEWRPPGSTDTCWHTSPGLQRLLEVPPV